MFVRFGSLSLLRPMTLYNEETNNMKKKSSSSSTQIRREVGEREKRHRTTTRGSIHFKAVCCSLLLVFFFFFFSFIFVCYVLVRVLILVFHTLMRPELATNYNNMEDRDNIHKDSVRSVTNTFH